jgi:hypothetical protein
MQVNLLNNTQTNFLFFICKNVDVKSKKQLRVGNMKNLISLPNLQKQNKYLGPITLACCGTYDVCNIYRLPVLAEENDT